jgi:protoheme IX farnesyltransferase
MNKIKDYIALTKPTILMLVVITGACVLVVNGSYNNDLARFSLVLIGLYAIGGAANALNQYFEREVDAIMARTKEKRPLAAGRISENEALGVIFVLFSLGLGIFYVYFTILSVVLSIFTILFYSFYYTLYLKPRTPQNIVIGGAAGAMGPLIAWAAVTGDLNSIIPWTIFALVFFWTPPHFWALALYLKEDYKKVNYPMMPLVVGDKKTHQLMLFYSIIMVICSFAALIYVPLNTAASSLTYIYGITCLALGYGFIKKVLLVKKINTEKSQRSLFGYSIIYVFIVCFSMMIDALV